MEAYLQENIWLKVKEGVSWLEKSASQEFFPAQERLGLYYFNGEILKEDKKEAFRWLKPAADKGSVLAQKLVAASHFYGDYLQKDMKASFDYFMLAANQGDPFAQNSVGNSFFYGQGTDINYEEALNGIKVKEQGLMRSAKFR